MKKEFFIKSTLRKLSKQRLALMLQPGNVWVIEKALKKSEDTESALRTCHLRGWVEPLSNAIPKGQLTPDGQLPEGNPFSEFGPIYRLTEAGWSVIHRTHFWVMATFLVALATLLATLLPVFKVSKNEYQDLNRTYPTSIPSENETKQEEKIEIYILKI